MVHLTVVVSECRDLMLGSNEWLHDAKDHGKDVETIPTTHIKRGWVQCRRRGEEATGHSATRSTGGCGQ